MAGPRDVEPDRASGDPAGDQPSTDEVVRPEVEADPRSPADVIWLDGERMPAGQARIDPSDRGLLLGEGLFETLLAVQGRPVLAGRHWQRLSTSAEALGIPLRWTPERIDHACRELLTATGLDRGLAALRVTLTGGAGPRGLLPPADPRPRLLITAAPQSDGLLPPARVILASARVSSSSPLRRHKSLSYLESILARREAAAAGADEALLLGEAGQLVEASAANLFLVDGSRLRTPPVSDGALPGITRGLLLELAAEVGLEPREERLGLDDLRQAEAVLLTSSLIGLRPVIALLGGSDPREALEARWPADPPALRRLRARYEREIGLGPGHRPA